MATKVGPTPWSHEDFWNWREGFKRTSKATLKKQGVEWSLGSGYRHKQDWEEKPKKPKTKSIRLYNGRVVEVPDADYEDYIGHLASPPAAPDTAVGQYIDKAFEDLSRVHEVEGVGHIVLIEYVPTYQILRVEFRDGGAVVVFFRVPKEVYSELRHLAESGAMAISTVDGTQRHVLGMRFWDIIRIRGQREGGRYRYEYAIENEYMSKGTVGAQRLGAIAVGIDGDKELKDTLRAFTRRLTPAAKQVFDNLETPREMYSFLRKHNVDLPTYEELQDPDF